VVLALALLIVGAIALFGAMNSSNGPTATPTATAAASAPHAQQPSTSSAVPNPGPHAVVLRVIGPSVSVTVSNSSNTVVLLRGTLVRGEVRTYDDPDLVVTVDQAQNVDVEIHGKLVSKGKIGRQFYTE
jgi:hypothetical protein